MTRRRWNVEPEYLPNIQQLETQVKKSFEIFTDEIGYLNSPLRSEFIVLLEQRYAFLYKFINFSRTSRFWVDNRDKLKKQEKEMRAALNRELLIRRNAKPLCELRNPNNVSNLASFIFCPVSAAIKVSYDIQKSDEIRLSEELREKNLLENFIASYIASNINNFLITEMNKDSNNKYRLYHYNDFSTVFKMPFEFGKKEYSFITYEDKERNRRLRNELNLSQDEILDKLKNLPTEYIKELIRSKIIFKGFDKSPDKAFYNKKYDIYGIPDYVFENHSNTKFLVLEKHSWNESCVNDPYINHVIQAIAYMYFYPELKLQYSYIIYLKNSNDFYLFRINLTDRLISSLLEAHSNYSNFIQSRKLEFNPGTINLHKCFKCSVRMFCSHKSGLKDKITIPYKVL